MGTVKLMKFWSSIINDDSVRDNLKSVMTIEDREECALQLISRTLFLLVMEIKHERDEAAENLKQIKENGSICSSCGDRIPDNTINVWPIKDSDVNYTKSKNQREVGDISPAKSPTKAEITSKQINQICEDENSETSHDAPELKDRKSPKSHKKAKNNYRRLSRSPKRVSPKISKDDEGEAKRIKAIKVKKIVPDVLVPETLSLDEHDLYVNPSKRKALATQTVSVPDTLAMDNTRIVDKDQYENTDFFGSTLISEGEACEEEVNALDSPIRKKMETPSKDGVKVSEPKIHQSPVLGKQNRLATSGAAKQSTKADFPKALDFEDVNEESLGMRTPDSRGIKGVEPVTSTPRYSPLLFTHNLSTSLNNSDHTSPSLLPAIKSKNARCDIEENWTPASLFKPSDCIQIQEEPSLKTRKGFQKSMSNCDMSSTTTKSHSLRKYQSIDRKNKGVLIKMFVEPTDPKTKKKYKQTKISASTFQQKTKIAGGGQSKSFSMLDEAAAIGAALEDSLKTKALDDMMREKREALLAGKASSHKTLDGATTVTDGKCDQNARGKLNDAGHSAYSDVSGPSVSPGVPVASKIASCSPSKEKIERKEESPIKIPKLTPGSCRTSPGKRQQESPCSPVKKKRVLKQGKTKKKEEEEVLDLDELLNKVSQSQNDAVQTVSKKLVSPQKETAHKKRKKEVFLDSFDIIPIENKEPNFAYRGDVVRKKGARKQLEGWQCHECEQWYKGQDLNSAEIKIMMNKCSRHRSKHNPVTNTPKDFWNPDWIEDD